MCKLKIFVIAILTLVLFACGGGSTADRSADIDSMVAADPFLEEEDSRCVAEVAAKTYKSDASWNYYVATVMGDDLPELSDSESAKYGLESLSFLGDMEEECQILGNALQDLDDALEELENFSWD
tara:strand:- start:325 stop:699 length:375 start_codon:yes stop_codon:yes gene_type:complete